MFDFRRRSVFLSTVAIVAGFAGSAAVAQGLGNLRGPAEFPPASYTGNQYVDSRGCVFIRAGVGGNVNWVARVSPQRRQLCGFEPTQITGAAVAAAPMANVPNPLDGPVSGSGRTQAPAQTASAPAPAPAAPVATPAPAPQVAAAPAVANPLVSAPAAAAPRQVASPSPRVISAPAPEPAPPQITRAQVCENRTGVQPGFISSRTGQPIDCGGAAPAPQVAQVAAPAQVQAPQQGITRAQACADTALTGRPYIGAQTGLPVRCGPQTQRINPVTGGGTQVAAVSPSAAQATAVQPNTSFTAPQRPYSNPLDAAPGSFGAVTQRPQTAGRSLTPYSNPLDGAPGSTFAPDPAARGAYVSPCANGVATASNLPVRCGPQVQSPSGGSASVTRARTATSGLGQALNLNPPPYSNPTYAVANPQPPQGYEPVWDDGRLNANRGLPSTQPMVRYASQPRQQQAVQVEQPRVSTRAAAPQSTSQAAPRPAEQISGHRYVQVGNFTTRDQAQSVAQALRAQGLPMRVGVYQQNGQEMRIVLAGPFANDSQLQSALGTARNAGFSGAFLRR